MRTSIKSAAMNSTSVGKGDFASYVSVLCGATPPPDTGLAGWTTPGPNQVTLSWPNTLADTLLETSGTLGASAHWTWVTAPVNSSGDLLTVTAPASSNQFFRVRRPWQPTAA